MNAGQTTKTSMERLGQTAVRIAIGFALALMLGGIASGDAMASKKTSYPGKVSPTLTANEYADICDDAGASDIKVTHGKGGTTVTCSWGDDLTSSCNFKTKTCTDTFREAPEEGGPAIGGDLSVADASPGADTSGAADVQGGVVESVAPETATADPPAGEQGVQAPVVQDPVIISGASNTNQGTIVKSTVIGIAIEIEEQ